MGSAWIAFDRKTSRHNWRAFCRSDDSSHTLRVADIQWEKTKEWASGKQGWDQYEIKADVFVDTMPDELPKNYQGWTPNAVAWKKEGPCGTS